MVFRNRWEGKPSGKVFMSRRVVLAKDAGGLVGSLGQLGRGRVISRSGSLAVARHLDFGPIDSKGRHLPFTGGQMELDCENLRGVISRGVCSANLTVSLLDREERLVVVFDFSVSGDKGVETWWKEQEAGGIAGADHWWGTRPLCWSELWPPHEEGGAGLSREAVEEKLLGLIACRQAEIRIRNSHLILTTTLKPMATDTDGTMARFWDRPRTQVCYADMSRVGIGGGTDGRCVLWNPGWE